MIFNKLYISENHPGYYGLVGKSLVHDRAVREVGASNPGPGTIVRGIFHPTKQLARSSPPNIVNDKFV